MAKRATCKLYFKNSLKQENKGHCKDEDKSCGCMVKENFFLFLFFLFYNQKTLSKRHLHKWPAENILKALCIF